MNFDDLLHWIASLDDKEEAEANHDDWMKEAQHRAEREDERNAVIEAQQRKTKRQAKIKTELAQREAERKPKIEAERVQREAERDAEIEAERAKQEAERKAEAERAQREAE